MAYTESERERKRAGRAAAVPADTPPPVNDAPESSQQPPAAPTPTPTPPAQPTGSGYLIRKKTGGTLVPVGTPASHPSPTPAPSPTPPPTAPAPAGAGKYQIQVRKGGRYVAVGAPVGYVPSSTPTATAATLAHSGYNIRVRKGGEYVRIGPEIMPPPPEAPALLTARRDFLVGLARLVGLRFVGEEIVSASPLEPEWSDVGVARSPGAAAIREKEYAKRLYELLLRDAGDWRDAGTNIPAEVRRTPLGEQMLKQFKGMAGEEWFKQDVRQSETVERMAETAYQVAHPEAAPRQKGGILAWLAEMASSPVIKTVAKITWWVDKFNPAAYLGAFVKATWLPLRNSYLFKLTGGDPDRTDWVGRLLDKQYGAQWRSWVRDLNWKPDPAQELMQNLRIIFETNPSDYLWTTKDGGFDPIGALLGFVLDFAAFSAWTMIGEAASWTLSYTAVHGPEWLARTAAIMSKEARAQYFIRYGTMTSTSKVADIATDVLREAYIISGGKTLIGKSATTWDEAVRFLKKGLYVPEDTLKGLAEVARQEGKAIAAAEEAEMLAAAQRIGSRRWIPTRLTHPWVFTTQAAKEAVTVRAVSALQNAISARLSFARNVDEAVELTVDFLKKVATDPDDVANLSTLGNVMNEASRFYVWDILNRYPDLPQAVGRAMRGAAKNYMDDMAAIGGEVSNIELFNHMQKAAHEAMEKTFAKYADMLYGPSQQLPHWLSVAHRGLSIMYLAANPKYALRNLYNNVFTALIDGEFALKSATQMLDEIRQVTGSYSMEYLRQMGTAASVAALGSSPEEIADKLMNVRKAMAQALSPKRILQKSVKELAEAKEGYFAATPGLAELAALMEADQRLRVTYSAFRKFLGAHKREMEEFLVSRGLRRDVARAMAGMAESFTRTALYELRASPQMAELAKIIGDAATDELLATFKFAQSGDDIVKALEKAIADTENMVVKVAEAAQPAAVSVGARFDTGTVDQFTNSFMAVIRGDAPPPTTPQPVLEAIDGAISSTLKDVLSKNSTDPRAFGEAVRDSLNMSHRLRVVRAQASKALKEAAQNKRYAEYVAIQQRLTQETEGVVNAYRAKHGMPALDVGIMVSLGATRPNQNVYRFGQLFAFVKDELRGQVALLRRVGRLTDEEARQLLKTLEGTWGEGGGLQKTLDAIDEVSERIHRLATAEVQIRAADLEDANKTFVELKRQADRITKEIADADSAVEAAEKELNAAQAARATEFELARLRRDLERIKGVRDNLQAQLSDVRQRLAEHEAEVKKAQERLAAQEEAARAVARAAKATPKPTGAQEAATPLQLQRKIAETYNIVPVERGTGIQAVFPKSVADFSQYPLVVKAREAYDNWLKQVEGATERLEQLYAEYNRLREEVGLARNLGRRDVAAEAQLGEIKRQLPELERLADPRSRFTSLRSDLQKVVADWVNGLAPDTPFYEYMSTLAGTNAMLAQQPYRTATEAIEALVESANSAASLRAKLRGRHPDKKAIWGIALIKKGDAMEIGRIPFLQPAYEADIADEIEGWFRRYETALDEGQDITFGVLAQDVRRLMAQKNEVRMGVTRFIDAIKTLAPESFKGIRSEDELQRALEVWYDASRKAAKMVQGVEMPPDLVVSVGGRLRGILADDVQAIYAFSDPVVFEGEKGAGLANRLLAPVYDAGEFAAQGWGAVEEALTAALPKRPGPKRMAKTVEDALTRPAQEVVEPADIEKLRRQLDTLRAAYEQKARLAEATERQLVSSEERIREVMEHIERAQRQLDEYNALLQAAVKQGDNAQFITVAGMTKFGERSSYYIADELMGAGEAVHRVLSDYKYALEQMGRQVPDEITKAVEAGYAKPEVQRQLILVANKYGLLPYNITEEGKDILGKIVGQVHRRADKVTEHLFDEAIDTIKGSQEFARVVPQGADPAEVAERLKAAVRDAIRAKASPKEREAAVAQAFRGVLGGEKQALAVGDMVLDYVANNVYDRLARWHYQPSTLAMKALGHKGIVYELAEGGLVDANSTIQRWATALGQPYAQSTVGWALTFSTSGDAEKLVDAVKALRYPVTVVNRGPKPFVYVQAGARDVADALADWIETNFASVLDEVPENLRLFSDDIPHIRYHWDVGAAMADHWGPPPFADADDFVRAHTDLANRYGMFYYGANILHENPRWIEDIVGKMKAAAGAPELPNAVAADAIATTEKAARLRKALEFARANKDNLLGTAHSLTDEETLKALDAFHQWAYTAMRYAVSTADFTMLNYGATRQFDYWLRFLFLYPYWYTRTIPHWAARILTHPQILKGYAAYSALSEWASKDLPIQYRGGFPITVGDNVFYIDIANALNPLNSLVERYENREFEATAGGRIYQVVTGWGPSPWPWWTVLAYSRLMEDPRKAYITTLPFSGIVRSITALLRLRNPDYGKYIPAGGLDIDAITGYPLVSALAGPQKPRVTDKPNVDRMTAEMLWRWIDEGYITKEQAEEALGKQNELWQKAKDAAMAKRIWPNLSYLTGVNVYHIGREEMEITQARKAWTKLMSRGLTGEEWDKAVAEFEKEWPFYLNWKTVYSDPNERTKAYLTGLVYNKYAELRQQRDERKAQCRPGDSACYRRADEWMQNEFQKYKEVVYPEFEFIDSAHRDPSEIYYQQLGVIFRELEKTKPLYGKYLTTEEKNRAVVNGIPVYDSYTEYQAAVKRWMIGLPFIAAKSPFIQDLIRQTCHRLGAPRDEVEEYIASVCNAETYRAWKRYDDTIYTAIQNVYNKYYYEPYWDQIDAAEGTAERGEKVAYPPRPTEADIVQWVMREYPGKWTREQIKAAMPGRPDSPLSFEEARLVLNPESWERQQLVSLFWEMYYNMKDSGQSPSKFMKENGLDLAAQFVRSGRDLRNAATLDWLRSCVYEFWDAYGRYHGYEMPPEYGVALGRLYEGR